MKYRLFDAKVAALVISTMFAFGCESAPVEDDTVTAAEGADVSVSALQLGAAQDVERNLDLATKTVDLAAKEQNLDTETSQAWTAARLSSLGSGALDAFKAENGTARVSAEALAELRARLDAFDPVLDKLEERDGNLHPAVQEAYARLLGSIDALETIETNEQQSALGQKGLRKRRCCMVYFANGNIQQCESMKATKVGANLACGLLASAIPLSQMTVVTGKCGDQADCP